MSATAPALRLNRRVTSAVAVAVAVAGAGLSLPLAFGAQSHTLDVRISQGDGSHPGNGAGLDATPLGVSADGQVVAFSTAERLDDTEPNDAVADLYVRSGSTTYRLSKSTEGSVAFADVHVLPGGQVLFRSSRSATADDADGGFDDYYLWYPDGGFLNMTPGGGTGNAAAGPLISTDGAYIAFSTTAAAAGDPTPGDNEVLVYKVANYLLTLMTPGTYSGTVKAISADGSTVVYESTQAVTGDSDGNRDEFIATVADPTHPTEISQFPLAGGISSDVQFAGASPDLDSVAFATTQQLIAEDVDASYSDIYSWNGGTLGWLTKPGAGAPLQNANPSVTVPRMCAGGAAYLVTTEALSAGDTGSNQDVYRYAAGASTLLSAPAAANAFVSADSTCSKAALTTTGQLGGAGNQSGDPDLFVVTGSTPALLAVDVEHANDPSVYLDNLLFTSPDALTADDGDAFLDVYRATGTTVALVSRDTPAADVIQCVVGVCGLGGAASSDLHAVIVTTTAKLTSDDTDSAADVYRFTGVTVPDPTPSVSPTPSSSTAPSASVSPSAGPSSTPPVTAPLKVTGTLKPTVVKKGAAVTVKTGLTVVCPKPGASCRVTISITYVQGKKVRTLATRKLTLKAGTSAIAVVTLGPTAKATLKTAKHLSTKVVVRLERTSSKTITKTTTARLNAPAGRSA